MGRHIVQAGKWQGEWTIVHSNKASANESNGGVHVHIHGWTKGLEEGREGLDEEARRGRGN